MKTKPKEKTPQEEMFRIDAGYNEKRMHSSLGYWSPDEYERIWETGELEKLGIDPSFKLKGKPSN